jgi:uncharacterized protein (TIGR02246 family)
MALPAPEDMPRAFAAAWMARDAGALAALFAEDADFVNVVGIWWEDRAAIHKAHHYGLTTFFRDSRLTVGRVKLRMLAPRAAVVHARMILTGQRAADGTEAGPAAHDPHLRDGRTAGGLALRRGAEHRHRAGTRDIRAPRRRPDPPRLPPELSPAHPASSARAAPRASSVTVSPDSIRAISSTRAEGSSGTTRLVVMLPETDFSTRQ